MKGGCLCGEVQFEVTGPVTDIYKCHCSLCRRSTGTGGIAACLSASRDFAWSSGEEATRSFRKSANYAVCFCSKCGSPVPMTTPDGESYWIPAGLFDGETGDLKVGAHVYVGSKAPWDEVADSGVVFDEGFPDA